MKKNRLSFWLLLPCFVGMMLLCGKNMLEHPLTASLKTSSQPTFVRKWYTALQMQLGNRQRNGVYIGDTALYTLPKPLSETALSDTADIINQFYQKTELPVCVTAIPDAASFYSDTFPDGMPYVEQKPAIKQFYNAIDLHIRKTDAYYILEAESNDYIYYRTFPYWTSYGAYSVYRSVIQKLGFVPISYDHYTVSHVKSDARGALYQATQADAVMPDLIDVYENNSNPLTCMVTTTLQDGSKKECDSLYDADALQTENPYQFYLGEPAPLQVVTTNVQNGKKLLVIKDEWADCMIPFLAQHYETIYLVDLHHSTTLPAAADYQQVLFLCHTDTYTETEAFANLLTTSA